jgi:rhamnose transport system substrate-binding protein
MHSTSLRLAGLFVSAAVLATACSSGGSSAAPSSAATSAPLATPVATTAAATAEATAAATTAASVAASEAASGSPAASESASGSPAASESASGSPGASTGGTVIKATPGESVKMMLLPKFLGILPFDQANTGAKEAAAELKNPESLTFTGPTADNSVQGQIETLTNASTQGFKVVMISNNAGDQIAPVAEAAQKAGVKVVSWDSPIPSAKGESLFVAQVDFDSIGVVMADMTLSLTGPDGGDFAILSASPDAANQNAWIAAMKVALKDPKYAKLNLVATVYGNDKSEDSATAAIALTDKYPKLKVIMSPTTVGIAASAKAIQDNNLCDKVKVSGLGLPAEMVGYTLNGCAPQFALWSFVDLGYLTYYTSYMLATGQLKGVEGEQFEAGRLGTKTIEKDPTRKDIPSALRVLMGPFTVYDKTNVEAAAK